MAFLVALAGLVLMLVVANGAPILARGFLGHHGAWRVDGGRRGRDGRPLLGVSKTWRGVAAAIGATAIAGATLGLGIWFGAAFGACAMLGDLFSSYLKRRRGLAASARATGLDQLPEALLPMLLSHWWLEVGWATVIAASAIFFILVTQLSPLLYRLGVRKRPH
jgi:hypothetical protein